MQFNDEISTMLNNIDEQLAQMTSLQNLKRGQSQTFFVKDFQRAILLFVVMIGALHIVSCSGCQARFESKDYCALLTLAAIASACKVDHPNTDTSKHK